MTTTFSGVGTSTELFSGGEVTPFCGGVNAEVYGDVTAIGSSVGIIYGFMDFFRTYL